MLNQSLTDASSTFFRILPEKIKVTCHRTRTDNVWVAPNPATNTPIKVYWTYDDNVARYTITNVIGVGIENLTGTISKSQQIVIPDLTPRAYLTHLEFTDGVKAMGRFIIVK